MDFNIDVAIVVAFLLLTLYAGLRYGQGVKTIQDYALGGRNFSTMAMVATIVATYASGSNFTITLSMAYSEGFSDTIASFGIGMSFFILAFWFVPRMGEFLGKVSIAEMMGELYGNKVRVITALAGMVGAAGIIAAQFKMLGYLFSYFLLIPGSIAIISAGIIATIYSAFGGIRAVTFTDMLQAFSFGCIVPMIGFLLWQTFFESDLTIIQAASNTKFSFSEIFASDSPKLFGMLVLFMYFINPAFNPADFQRIAIGKNIEQVKKAFIIAGMCMIIIQCLIAWIPFLLHAIEPNLEDDQLLGYIIDNFSFTGLKGLIIVAVIAFAMSTADSYINSSSVLFTHDIYGLIVKNQNKELIVAKFFALILGISAICLALVETDLLGVIIFANSFYTPLVGPAFIFTVFGFRSSEKSVLIGMIAGFVITSLWKFLPEETFREGQDLAGLLFAMLCNAIFLIGSHYLLRQPGGWVGIKDRSYLDQQAKKGMWKKRLIVWWREFNLVQACKKIAPKNEATYVMLGMYFLLCTITTMYTTQFEMKGEHKELFTKLYPFMLITSTTMMIYPMWPRSIATQVKEAIIGIWYPISIFYMMILFNIFFLLVSEFVAVQMLLFSVNLIVATLLLGWRLGLPSIIFGFILGVWFYRYIFDNSGFVVQFGSPEFILIYAVLVATLAIIMFIRPKQEYLEATEAKVETLDHELTDLNGQVINLNEQVGDLNDKVSHYSQRVNDHEQEIERLGSTAQKILNNVNHELRLPIGNVINFSDMLHDTLQKSDDKLLKDLSEEVFKNSTRVSSMILNMLDLATLEVKKVDLNKQTINFGELVTDRVKHCRKIYLQDKKITFELTIQPEVMIAVDPDYIRQMVDNLVINAMNYTTEGLIKVFVYKVSRRVELIIEDQGMGIPQKDIYDIFDPFKMGSNTESKAEGRGIGLALCKSVAEAHSGSITAESNGIKGAKFTIILPIC